MDTSRRQTYSPAAKALHWLIVLLMVIQFPIGWLMPDVHRGPPVETTEIHMSFGLLILALIVIQFIRRMMFGTPALVPGLPAWQRVAAQTMHLGLYALLVFFTFTGWCFASFFGWPIRFFGLFPIPGILPKGTPIARTFGELHQVVVWIVLIAIAGHIAAALWHHFVDKDRTLIRMLPRALAPKGTD